MRDFRGPVPLTDADYAAVRRNVLANREPRRPRFSVAFRLAFATIVVTFAALITPRPETPVPMSVERATLITETPAPTTNHQPPITTASQNTQPPARSTQHAAPGPLIPLTPSPVRIEIQTSDPDIRIIWIANQHVSTEENS